MAIDYLCNLFTEESIRKNYLQGEELERFASVGRDKGLRGYSTSKFIELMDAAGVDHVLIPSLITWSYMGQRPIEETLPSEVIEVVEESSGRISGLYGVNPRKAMDGVRELERLVVDHSFKGIHIHPHGFGFPPDHPFFFPFYAKCQELSVTVVISMGHTIDFMPIEIGRPIHLDMVALYFSDLRIVMAHTGWPWVEEGLALVGKHPNLYLGTSAYAPKYWKPEMIRFLDSRRGRNKVLWGTDWPLIGHDEALKQIADLGVRDETYAAITHDNAARVFGLH